MKLLSTIILSFTFKNTVFIIPQKLGNANCQFHNHNRKRLKQACYTLNSNYIGLLFTGTGTCIAIKSSAPTPGLQQHIGFDSNAICT